MDNQGLISLFLLASCQDTKCADHRVSKELVLCLQCLPYQPILFLSPQAS